jgi:hypothetical protein
LAAIGSQSSISSIGPPDTSTESVYAALLYQPKIDALHRAAHWNCTRFQETLTLLKAMTGTPDNPDGSLSNPPIPWLYEYAYPVDCLKARFIVPVVQQSGVGVPLTTGQTAQPIFWGGAAVKFVVATDTNEEGRLVRVILTNMRQAQLVYTKRITDPNMWDPHFLDAATATLAANFVNPLSRNRALLADQVAMAREIIQQARISDSNEGLVSQDTLPDFIAVRANGSAWNTGIVYQGWDQMSFPGGFVV